MAETPKGQASAPGTAPNAHLRTAKKDNAKKGIKKGDILKTKKGGDFKTFRDFIVYAKEQDSDGFERYFIGPATRHWAEEIGHTHEFGGSVRKRIKLTFRRKKGGVRKRDTSGRFVKSKHPAKVVRVFTKTRKYPKRPFMVPAMVKTSKKFSQLAGRVGD